MRERAELADGKLTVWSAPGTGIELEVGIPASRACAAPRSRGRPGVNGEVRGVVSPARSSHLTPQARIRLLRRWLPRLLLVASAIATLQLSSEVA
jgi:hypothetical protein